MSLAAAVLGAVMLQSVSSQNGRDPHSRLHTLSAVFSPGHQWVFFKRGFHPKSPLWMIFNEKINRSRAVHILEY